MEAARKTGQTLQGAFKYCVDDSGQVTNVVTIQSTQVQNYDAKIATAVKKWTFKPVLLEGRAVAV